MVQANFTKAEGARRSHQTSLQFLEDQLTSHAVVPLDEVTTDQLLQMTDTLKTNLQANHEELELHAPASTDMIPIREEHSRLLTRGLRAFSQLRGIKMGFPPPAQPATPAPTPCSSQTAQIRLPQIDLPNFSGDIQDWVSFRDTFETAVSNSTTLSKSQKLTYLKSCLSGEAARHVKSLVICDANFDIAWTALTDRYHNDRELLFCILKRLLHQPNSSSSPVSLRNLVDVTKECLRSLEVLTIPVIHWDAIIVFILFQKLDSPSRELWEQYIRGTAIPKLSEMFEFLEQRARAIAAGSISSHRPHQPSHHSSHQPVHQQQQRSSFPRVSAHNTQPSNKCPLGCNINHALFSCLKFNGMSAADRLKTVDDLNVCKNCLSPTHAADKCRSSYTCKFCKKPHISLVHQEPSRSSSSTSEPSTSQFQQHTPTSFHAEHLPFAAVELPKSIRPTAIVKIANPTNLNVPARCFLDSGSTNSFITMSLVRSLGLQSNMRPYNVPLKGFQDTDLSHTKGIIDVRIRPHFSSEEVFNVTALVVQKICNDIPSETFRPDSWPHLTTLQLADPKWYYPAPVDILLGSDVFWEILLSQKLSGPAHDEPGMPKAFNSHLGWLVAGEVLGSKKRKVVCKHVMVNHSHHSIQPLPEKQKDSTSDDLLPLPTTSLLHHQVPARSPPVPAPWILIPVYNFQQFHFPYV